MLEHVRTCKNLLENVLKSQEMTENTMKYNVIEKIK